MGNMRITESQLRRIIRQEVRVLRESNLSPGPSPSDTEVYEAWYHIIEDVEQRRAVHIEVLSAVLGVPEESIRWDKTGLMLDDNGYVVELL